jgi:hypothetical protein
LTVFSRSIRRICPEARLSRDREGAVSRSGVLMPWFDFFWSAVRSARHLVRSRHRTLHPQEISWRYLDPRCILRWQYHDSTWSRPPRERWCAGLLLFLVNSIHRRGGRNGKRNQGPSSARSYIQLCGGAVGKLQPARNILESDPVGARLRTEPRARIADRNGQSA